MLLECARVEMYEHNVKCHFVVGFMMRKILRKRDYLSPLLEGLEPAVEKGGGAGHGGDLVRSCGVW